MSSKPLFEGTFSVQGGDYAHAGSVSIAIRKLLQELGLDKDTTRSVAIIAYEAEVNIVLYADDGRLSLQVYPDVIRIQMEDSGPGIEDIEMALQEGYSTATARMRELGFGAGMGLPNIKRNADGFSITSTSGKGTKLEVEIRPKENRTP